MTQIKPDYRLLILEHGDDLERKIFSDEEFANDFHCYLAPWAEYVYRNRMPDDPTIVKPEWMPFASHHYTAIIRCWIARTNVTDLCRACDRTIAGDGLALLDIHNYALCFFAAIQSTIDNLWHAKRLKLKAAQLKLPQSLDGLRLKRNHFIHDALIPFVPMNNSVYLNEAMLNGEGWNPPVKKVIDLKSAFETQWKDFKSGISDYWGKLYGGLSKKFPVTVPVLNAQQITDLQGNLIKIYSTEEQCQAPAASGQNFVSYPDSIVSGTTFIIPLPK